MAARIRCFTDVMCGWAYLGEARLDQLEATFGERIELSLHFLPTYGDVRGRLDRSGRTDAAFGALVRSVLERHEHVQVHPEVFTRDLPVSSAPAHLYLRAVHLVDADALRRMAGRVLPRLPSSTSTRPRSPGASTTVAPGRPWPATPTLVLDDGRQVLAGDVSYGVLSANVRELVAR